VNTKEKNLMITLIDCTLRDGGYYNSWDFDLALINEYLAAMHAADVEFVEIGFRSFDRSGFKGACAYSTDDFISSLPVAPTQKIGVMVNAAEIVKHPAGVLEATRLLFRPRSQSPVTLVRFACHLHEFEQTLSACAWLKEQGYQVGINLMQVADRTDEEVEHIGKLAAGYPLDVLYFADSLGSMDPDQTSRIVALLRRHWSGAIGIHTHDNMGRAIANTLRAIEEGATWVDSTVTGMGRGPGNAQTEYLLIELEGKRAREPRMSQLLALIRQRFGPMQQACGWGKNPYYYLSGKYGIHPSYVQEMLADPRYGEAEILAVIEHLRSVGGKKFSVEAMERGRQMYGEDVSGSWAPASVLAGRVVLVLGAGPSAKDHAAALEAWIRRARPVVLALNTVSPISAELIDYRVASHPFRLMADAPAYAGMQQPLIAPASRLGESLGQSIAGVRLFDFGLSVQPGAFAFAEDGAVVPSSLAIAYALAIASSGRADRVLLAGFDGYAADDPRFAEMSELLAIYQASQGATAIEAVTPTRYSIPSTSIYAL
jgi:4-hydroxy 2-oxovalerate aldolase